MTGLAHICGIRMPSLLAPGSEPVVTAGTVSCHFCVIELGADKGVSGVAIFTDIGACHVEGVLAPRLGTVMTALAAGGYTGVIKCRGSPVGCPVAALALFTAVDMAGRFTRRRGVVVTGGTVADNRIMINRGAELPVRGRMTGGAVIPACNVRQGFTRRGQVACFTVTTVTAPGRTLEHTIGVAGRALQVLVLTSQREAGQQVLEVGISSKQQAWKGCKQHEQHADILSNDSTAGASDTG